MLFLSSEEVLEKDKTRDVLDLLDKAVANSVVGIVVLRGGGASGGKLYEAACLLKSVIKERAYLLIDERVDIAAAVSASGVLLSDQGHLLINACSLLFIVRLTNCIGCRLIVVEILVLILALALTDQS